MSYSEPSGQGWPQITALLLAFFLSALIGLEREIRNKNAGLRTYTIIGFTAALIMLTSKYGFTNVVVRGTIRVDPSRIAAQIVVGIGFIGGGLIFVKGESVRGLTTAASVWLTAAVGMACGAGLPWLAVVVTAGQFLVAFGFPQIEKRLPGADIGKAKLNISYEDDEGRLAAIFQICAAQDFKVETMKLDRWAKYDMHHGHRLPVVSLALKLEGDKPVFDLAKQLGGTAGIVAVEASGG
jgi:putative Mg2+ transporter-C (MgtC) family protein